MAFSLLLWNCQTQKFCFLHKKAVQSAQKVRCTVDWRSIRDLNSGGATNALSHFECCMLFRLWVFLQESSGTCRKTISLHIAENPLQIRPNQRCNVRIWTQFGPVTSHEKSREFRVFWPCFGPFWGRWREFWRERKGPVFRIVTGFFPSSLSGILPYFPSNYNTCRHFPAVDIKSKDGEQRVLWIWLFANQRVLSPEHQLGTDALHLPYQQKNRPVSCSIRIGTQHRHRQENKALHH